MNYSTMDSLQLEASPTSTAGCIKLMDFDMTVKSGGKSINNSSSSTTTKAAPSFSVSLTTNSNSKTSSKHNKSKNIITKTTKKRVRFQPAMDIATVHQYRAVSSHYFSKCYFDDKEYDAILDGMRTTLEMNDAYPQLVQDSTALTMRGLERRTHAGHAERMEWRYQCRTAVLDEQDRQWSLLDASEATDAEMLALASLSHSRESRQLAVVTASKDSAAVAPVTPVGILEADEEEDDKTVLMDASFRTMSSRSSMSSSISSSLSFSNSSSNSASSATSSTTGQGQPMLQYQFNMSTSSLAGSPGRRLSESSNASSCWLTLEEDGLILEEEELSEEDMMDASTPNTKGASVHFSKDLHQVHEYLDDSSPDTYSPYLTLHQAKQKFRREISYLGGGTIQDGGKVIDLEEDSLRGLEAYTIANEASYQDRQEALLLALLDDDDTLELAKNCQSLTAKSRRSARSRGLVDHRVAQALDKEADTETDSKPKAAAPFRRQGTPDPVVGFGSASRSLRTKRSSLSLSKEDRSALTAATSALTIDDDDDQEDALPALLLKKNTPMPRQSLPNLAPMPAGFDRLATVRRHSSSALSIKGTLSLDAVQEEHDEDILREMLSPERPSLAAVLSKRRFAMTPMPTTSTDRMTTMAMLMALDSGEDDMADIDIDIDIGVDKSSSSSEETDAEFDATLAKFNIPVNIAFSKSS